MFIPWQPFVLAIANRCRGGLINIKAGQLARLVLWAVPFSAVLILSVWDKFSILKWDWQIAYVVFLVSANFGGACLPAWGKYDQKEVNWCMLGLQGWLFLAPGAICLLILNSWVSLLLIPAGWLISVCYALGWEILSTVKGFERGTPLGELFFGFVIGLFIYFALFLAS